MSPSGPEVTRSTLTMPSEILLMMVVNPWAMTIPCSAALKTLIFSVAIRRLLDISVTILNPSTIFSVVAARAASDSAEVRVML
ncbi:hypothetical protein Mapa_005735 [Marchantia paleacea]|nr:hypothetical protein Mapa_005735 [Marchantia paleacea]